jgi:hypothetical protein
VVDRARGAESYNLHVWTDHYQQLQLLHLD